jgi:hypothetical protein
VLLHRDATLLIETYLRVYTVFFSEALWCHGSVVDFAGERAVSSADERIAGLMTEGTRVKGCLLIRPILLP